MNLLAGIGFLAFCLSACSSNGAVSSEKPGSSDSVASSTFSSSHTHTFSEEWTYDSNYHWHEATCGHDEIANKESHNMKEQVFDPTYEEAGYTLHYCDCGYSYTDNETSKLEHHFDQDNYEHDEQQHWRVCTDQGYKTLTSQKENHVFTSQVVNPTYEEEGYTLHSCICGYFYKDNEVAALEHHYADDYEYNETEHWHPCTDSGYEEISKDKASHNFTSQVVNPTYEEKGYTLHICACGYSFKNNETDKLEHNYDMDNYVYDETEHWHVCIDNGFNDLFTGKASHHFVESVIPPTFTSGGYTLHTCECGYSYQDAETEPLEHTYSSEFTFDSVSHWHACVDEGFENLTSEKEYHSFVDHVVEPTFTSGGYTLHTCECGYSYQDTQTEPLEHNYADEYSFDENTHWRPCTDKGFENWLIDMDAHDYSEIVVPSTYEEQGYTLHTCNVCQYSYKTDFTLKKEHKYSNAYSSNATHHWYACTDSGYENLNIGKAEHSFTDQVFAPDYDVQGYTLHTCTVCGYSYKSDYVAALEHHYTDTWTYDFWGHWHDCVDVGYETLHADFSTHHYQDTVVAPTFENEGYTSHRCTECGYTTNDTYTSRVPHNYAAEWTYNETNHWHACTDAGYEDFKSGDTAHDYGDWVVDVAATPTTDGSKHHICNTCGYQQDEVIYATGTVDKLSFNLAGYGDEQYYEVSKKDNDIDGEIIIPANYNGKPVKEIAKSGFNGAKNFTSIVFGANITAVGESAFGATNVESITFNDGIKNIGIGAFSHVNSLTELEIPESIESIGRQAFYYCKGLTKVNIKGNNLKSIGTDAFNQCLNLTDLRIPSSIEAIGMLAFNDVPLTNNMSTYMAGNYIGNEDNPYLIYRSIASALDTYVTIHSRCRILLDEGFKDYDKMKSNFTLNIPNSVVYIGDYFCSDARKLGVLTLGNSVKSIGYQAFNMSNYVTTLVIPNSVETIKECAFIGFNKMTSLTIGTGVKSIEKNAFSGSKLTSLTFKAIYCRNYGGAYDSFYNSCPLTEITLSNEVRILGNYMFAQFTKLTTVNLNHDLEQIEYSVFYGCTALTTVNYDGTVEEFAKITHDSAPFNTVKEVHCSDGVYTIQ